MARSSIGLGLALAASILVTVPAMAAVPTVAALSTGVAPSGGSPWIASDLGVVDRDPCVPVWGLASCTRSGGLAAAGLATTLVHTDGTPSEFGHFSFAVAQRSANGGVSFGAGHVFSENVEGPDLTQTPALAQRGMALDLVYDQPGLVRQIRVRHSGNLGQTWGAAKGYKSPRQVVANLAIANGPGGRVAYAVAAFDEVAAGRAEVALEVRASRNNGATFPVSKRFTWSVPFCGLVGTDPSITITKGGVIVIAYWRTCTKLLVRRSTDGGHSWSKAKRLSSTRHSTGMAIAARQNRVVLAYATTGSTLVRRSNDRGATWSAPVAAGSGAKSLRLAYGGGAWRLLAGGRDRIVYRTSGNGIAWSAGETVAESLGARTYAIGMTHGTMPLAAYVIRTTNKVHHAYVARRP